MSIQYKVVKQIFGFDQTKSEKFVARSVTGQMLHSEEFCNQVCQITGIHRSVVGAVFGGVLDVLVNNMNMGHSVQLGEFGILRPGIQAKAQDSEEATTASTVYRRKINFTPGKMLKNFLGNVSVTRMAIQDVDYTDGSSGGGTKDPDDGYEQDPNA